MFSPTFSISPATANSLVTIEIDRRAIMALPINLTVLAGLRESARLAATHYSTQIEGNRLTQAEVVEVLQGAHFPGRERDEAEVRNYYRALEYVESIVGKQTELTEQGVRRIHGLVWKGTRTPTPYRPDQNVIRDSSTGRIVYLPPEAHDVPELMAELVAWINNQLTTYELPVPILAAIAHYQFATIHPYYDGNGRTARLLTTLVLHRAGYGLKGVYSLDEHYARNLMGYYGALTVGPSHNYYLGRAEADITGFIDYFCNSMSDALSAVRVHAVDAQEQQPSAQDDSKALRRLDPRARRLLELFREYETVTTTQIAEHLEVSSRTANTLTRRWIENGFLEVVDPARRTRSYRLTRTYERLIG